MPEDLVDAAIDALLPGFILFSWSFGPSSASLRRPRSLSAAVGLLSVSVGKMTSELEDIDDDLL
jgi:hypothetical protein